jgi:hypothetical protein
MICRLGAVRCVVRKLASQSFERLEIVTLNV